MTRFESLSLLIGFLNLLAAYGGLGLVYHGIRTMDRNAQMRAEDSERKHDHAMAESERRHVEVMAESKCRHDEAMAAIDRRHDETMVSLRALIDSQAEGRKALRESIEAQNESREALRTLVARTSGESA